MKKNILLLMLFTLLTLFLVSSRQSGAETDGSVTDPPDYRAFLKIDLHTHVFADFPEYVQMMRRNNIKGINICTGGTDPAMVKMQQEIAEKIANTYPDTFAFASTFDLTSRDQEDYAEKTDEWLTSCVESGALMIKMWKDVGMEIRDRSGNFIMPDDELFNPVYRRISQLGQPLITHFAEPIEAWRPLNPEGAHYGYYSKHPEWHFYGKEGVPSWEEIIAARDRVLERNRYFYIIGAHLGSMSHDVDEVAMRLDKYPNFYVDVAARTKDLSRQPREKVRNFFIKYQDRIMYGVDQTVMPGQVKKMTKEEKASFVESIQAGYRNHWDYYAGYGPVEISGRTVQGLNLPEQVLEKFYFRNARRVIPRLKF
jgi:predicted TIM-barrel fold metal-dependent hydrolase